MAKDDDLLPEDQPAGNLLPEEKMGGEASEPAPAAAAVPVEPPSPIAAELSAKPRSNVWTLLIAIIMASMIVGMYVQLRELNEIYKVNIPVIGQREGDTTIPDKDTTKPPEETLPDTSTPPPDTSKPPEAKAAAPEAKPAEPATLK